MTFFDTNILVYSTVNLDEAKQEISDRLIEEAIKDKLFSVSPLVVSEFIFVLSKLNIDKTLEIRTLLCYIYHNHKKIANSPLILATRAQRHKETQ